MNADAGLTIRVPASTSNLGPGFDTLGLALNRYLFISVEVVRTGEFHIEVEGNGVDHIARDESNLVYQGMLAAAAATRKTIPPVRLRLRNEIPAFGGLGGSGAAIVGGVFAFNELLGADLSQEQVLDIAAKVEGHPDNVSAALLGGLTISCFSGAKLHSRSIKIVVPLLVITCSPHFQVLTAEARQILPSEISIKDTVTNIENAASLVAALIQNDVEALRFVTHDVIHEPYRAKLIPGFAAVRDAALEAGALSCNISGAGPTVFSFATRHGEVIGTAMQQAFAAHGQSSSYEIMSVENLGARRVDKV